MWVGSEVGSRVGSDADEYWDPRARPVRIPGHVQREDDARPGDTIPGVRALRALFCMRPKQPTSGIASQQVRYMEAQYFSYYLGNELKWGRHSSQCNEMVIIFYSNEDQVLYTSTQPQARKLLTDDIVRTAVLETISADYPYTEPGQLASALMRLVRTYGR
ncbi:hypothetical protein MAR_017976 [Mya arenaria]|uniref:Uncharacterized protein n=1 Tax=Mya arenaria TaxID=6604 RepID=A0ABY7EH76_MYAAR|nr:hypothetical protein MAR_017976 [Mya arenaria]